MSEMYRSISVPVKATQWFKDGDHKDVVKRECESQPHDSWDEIFEYRLSQGETLVEPSDWIVEFATGEVHVVRDVHFKYRFERTNTFTKQELSAAVKMALQGDCA